MGEEFEENKESPRGVKRMINGELLGNVEANFDAVEFKRGANYQYSIELQIVPEFKEVVTK